MLQINSITVDTSEFIAKSEYALSRALIGTLKGVNDVGTEVLRLSSQQVPHDTGRLQNTGRVEPDTDHSVIVGYDTEYAARLHEHPEYRFQKGRKGKYLEDPIKNNLEILRGYIADRIKSSLNL